jgi:hypothetical protein
MFIQHALLWFLLLFTIAFPPLALITLPFAIWRITRTVRTVRLYRRAQQQAADQLWIAQLAAYGSGKR